MKFISPLHLHKGLSEAYKGILAGVPPYTAECRSVRVIPVLDAAGTRTCVVFVLAAQALKPASLAGARQPSARASKAGS